MCDALGASLLQLDVNVKNKDAKMPIRGEF